MSKFFKTFRLQTPLLPTLLSLGHQELRFWAPLFFNQYPQARAAQRWACWCAHFTPQLSSLLRGAVTVAQVFASLPCNRQGEDRAAWAGRQRHRTVPGAPHGSRPAWGLGSCQQNLGMQRCLNTSLQLTSNWLLFVRAYVNDKHLQMKWSTAKGV